MEWSARRPPIHSVLFNVGDAHARLARRGRRSSRSAEAARRAASRPRRASSPARPTSRVNTGLLSLALALEGHERWWRVWRERFAWLLPHYVAYGFVGGVIAIGYDSVGLYALAVFARAAPPHAQDAGGLPAHTRRAARRSSAQAAETIQTQNVSLEQANRLLKERSTAAMESLSATVDARDSYTAGHSRRVQQLALAIGRELGLSQAELDLLGHAALFHDIGKLAIPDAILLKPACAHGPTSGR